MTHNAIESGADLVYFVCGENEEQEEIHGVCRMLVASKSPVLHSMLLTSGMAESKLTRIRLPDIEAAPMRICLEFFYTDSVRPTSWCSSILLAMKAFKAANYFLLERLESLAIKYVAEVFLSYGFEHDWISEDFIAAYNLGLLVFSGPLEDTSSPMGHLLSDFRHRITCGMQIDQYVKSDCDYECLIYKSLSEHALAHLTKAPHWFRKDSLSEYYAFVHVVKWTAYRLVVTDPSIDEGELVKVLDKCFPWSFEVLATHMELNDANTTKFMKLIDEPLAECLQRVPLNFAKMPTDILCKFILILPATLSTAYKSRSVTANLQWDSLGHGDNYTIKKNDLTIISCNTGRFKGFARLTTYLDATNISCFDWEIVMLRPCKKLRIGFCLCTPTCKILDCNNHVVGDKEGSWALGGDGLLHHTNLDSKKYSIWYVDPFCGKEKATVRVHLDIFNRHCSFAINGNAAKMAWNDLPILRAHAVYPAISFQKPGRAQVRSVHQSGIECPSKRMRQTNHKE